MKKIRIEEILKSKCPNIQLACIQCTISIEAKPEGLWKYIDEECKELESNLQVEEINKLPAIAMTRKAYKAIGKDPSRYRPSAEALLRRVVKGKGLYRINNVVDLLNLVSVRSGFSIGGYDIAHIEGALRLGIGKEEEPYEAIGRGSLNIAGLPLFRDDKGAFGSPTSDSLRTMVRETSSQFLMVFFNFDALSSIDEWLDYAENLLKNYGGASSIERKIIS